MIRQNMLNLKQLNAELAALKAQKASFPSLFIISSILSYGHKIPIIGKFINKLSTWYGKTTIWMLLIYLRKLIVIFHAILGVYGIIAISGFSYDNIIAGFMSLGATYMEVLTNMVYKLYNFLFNLFDNKLIPNVPTNSSGSGWWWGPKQNTWFGKSMAPESPFSKIMDMSKSQDFYRTPYTKNNYSLFNIDLGIPTWVWYTLGALLVAGIAYTGYHWYHDQTIAETIKLAKGKAVAAAGDLDPQDTEIKLDAGSSSNAITSLLTVTGNYISRTTSKIVSITNPFNYFPTSNQRETALHEFLTKQSNMLTAERQYYPFTENNPFDPWYTKYHLSFFGESAGERSARLELANHFDEEFNRVIKVQPIEPGNLTSTVGIGTPQIATTSLFDVIHSQNLTAKLEKIPTTPRTLDALQLNHWVPEGKVPSSTRLLSVPLSPLPQFSKSVFATPKGSEGFQELPGAFMNNFS